MNFLISLIYLNLFKEKGYDNMKLLEELTQEDLDILGVVIPGHRKLLLIASSDLKKCRYHNGMIFFMFAVILMSSPKQTQ
jgi:hypothetical protein